MSIDTQNKEEIRRILSKADIQIAITLSVMAIVIFSLFVIFYFSTSSEQNKSKAAEPQLIAISY